MAYGHITRRGLLLRERCWSHVYCQVLGQDFDSFPVKRERGRCPPPRDCPTQVSRLGPIYIVRKPFGWGAFWTTKTQGRRLEDNLSFRQFRAVVVIVRFYRCCVV